MRREEKGITKEILDEVHKNNNINFHEEIIDKNHYDGIHILDLSRKYNENSKITRKNYEIFLKLESLFATAEMIKKLLNTYLSYKKAEEILLPTENLGISKSLYECVKNRRSIRNFTGEEINLNKLSKLLWHSYGITGMMKLREKETGEEILGYLRSIPSGGLLYPVGLYIGAINIKGMKQGIYHYNIKRHSLEIISEHKNFSDYFVKMFTIHPELVDIKKACAVIILSAAYWKQNGKYGPRGYRFALMEAGHIGQNIQLASIGMDLGSLCIGGFFDDKLNNLIGVDGVDESVVYAVAVGVPEIDTTFLPLDAGEAREEKI